MRAMKDSGIEWIGQIPQDWETIRAKYVTTITNGSDPKTEGNIPVYGSGSGCFKTCGEYKEGPTVLLGRKGTVDIPQYITGNYWNVDTAFDVKTQGDQLDLAFYYFASTCFDYKYYTATTTLPSMTQTNYGNMHIPFPSIDVQQRIVAGLKEKLAGIDALIAAKEKTNALLKERRQSIIYEAVTKGLNPDAPMKDSGIEWIGEISERWERIALKYCIQHVGSGTSVNAEDRPANADELGVLKTSCVSLGCFAAAENKTILENEYDRASCPVKADTVIVSRMNTPDLVGACGYVEEDHPNLYLPDRLWQVEFNNDCVAKYMWYFLTSKYVRDYYASVCTGTSGSMQNISQDQFGAIAFFKPSKIEQQNIAEYLDRECANLLSLIDVNEKSLQKFKEYRQSIIYEAVTGKIEI